MSPCELTQARLPALVMDLLAPEEARALRDHAAECPTCAAAIEAEQTVEAALRAALKVEVPAGLATDIKAALAPAPRRWPWMVTAAALAAGLVFAVVRPTPAPSPVRAVAGEAWLTAGATRRALTAGMRLADGDVVSASDGLVLVAGDTQLALGAGSRLIWGERPRLESGPLLATVPPRKQPFVIDTPAGQILSHGGHFQAVVNRPGDAMSPALSRLLLVAATAGTTTLVVRSLDGDVTVQNAHGAARLAPDEAAAAHPHRAPGPVAEDADALRGRLTQRDRTIGALRDEIRELKRAARAGGLAPRPAAEVQAAVRQLAKEMGLNIYTFLTPDTGIMKEIAAMGPEGVALLSDLLRTGTDDERFAAAAMMEKLGDPAAIPALAELLFRDDEGNTMLKRITSHAIAFIGGDEAIAPLERAVEEGSEWGIQANAAYGLAQMGRETGIRWLEETYRTTTDPMARAALLPAMAEVGDPSYLPLLHQILKEETEYSKRFMALHGIAKAAQPQSLPLLEALVDDPDRALAAAARKAYNEISGEDRFPVE